MSNRLLKTVALLAFTACSSLALADDPPARVGRVALAQGQVSIRSDDQPASAALVNWPVTSEQTITTAPGARTELRIGSTSVRLDGGSALEVLELDDERLRLRLHYGSASIRVVNPEVLAGFELSTPEARVRLREPGRLRVDAGRARDTSVVNVFDGEALVDGGGEQLTVRAGRRAEVREDDVRTAQAVRDGFDDWAYGRDQYEDSARSARYVTPEMTGYEDLDRYGSWRVDAQYGDLWMPSVGADWVPYRDGSWVWLDPWGWTWVDSAPWGYAPFHYGRWVHVNHRWAWAPGHHERHPVWSPALVGWVGGSNWSLAFGGRGGHRPQPAQGWYPLSPHDRFVPNWHASEQHLRSWNRDVRPDGRRGNEHRREGMTVMPHDAFGRQAMVAVSKALRASPQPLAASQAPVAAPPAPRERHDVRREDGHGRFDHDRNGNERGQADREHDGRGQFDRGQHAPQARAAQGPANPAPQQAGAMQQAQRAPMVLTAPPVSQAQPAPWQRGGRSERDAFEAARRQQEGRQHEALPDARGQQEWRQQQEANRDPRRQQEWRQQQEANRDPRRQQEDANRELRRQQEWRRQQEAAAGQGRAGSGMTAARPAAAQPQPAPLQTVPAPSPAEAGFVQRGGREPRAENERRGDGEHRPEAEGERRWRERAPAFEQRAVPPQSQPALIPQPPQAQHALIPQPPQAQHALIPQPPQAQHALIPMPEAARAQPPQQVAPPAPPAQAAPAPERRNPHGDGRAHGDVERNGRQQER